MNVEVPKSGPEVKLQSLIRSRLERTPDNLREMHESLELRHSHSAAHAENKGLHVTATYNYFATAYYRILLRQFNDAKIAIESAERNATALQLL